MPKRLPSTSGSSTQRVITAREKWPWLTNTTSRDSMCSSASAIGPVGALADLRDALAAGAAVRPHQPIGNRFPDLLRSSDPS